MFYIENNCPALPYPALPCPYHPGRPLPLFARHTAPALALPWPPCPALPLPHVPKQTDPSFLET